MSPYKKDALRDMMPTITPRYVELLPLPCRHADADYAERLMLPPRHTLMPLLMLPLLPLIAAMILCRFAAAGFAPAHSAALPLMPMLR